MTNRMTNLELSESITSSRITNYIKELIDNVIKVVIKLDNFYNKPDIIMLTETWLINTDDPSIYFNNYNIFLNNRTLKKRGGVLLYLQIHFRCMCNIRIKYFYYI